MTVAWIRSRLRLLARNEHGIALPTALFATIASLGLAGAAVMSSVDVQQGFKRDNGSKGAIAAADAGANVAMQRLNRYASALKGEDVCVNLGSSEELEPGGTPVGEPGWCAPIEGEVGGAVYRYQVSALGSGSCLGNDVCIVSTGTANEVSRRIELGLDQAGLGSSGSDPTTIQEELEWAKRHEATQKEIKEIEERLKAAESAAGSSGGAAGLIGKEEITLSGTDDIGFGVATDGNLVTSGNVSICGSIQTGIGKSWVWSGHKNQCAGYSVTQGNLSLPSVESFIPSDIATHNSNARLTKCTKGLPLECQKDTYNGSWNGTQPFNPNPTARSINLSGSKTLTVGGGDYWICSLTLSGSQELIMAAGAHVRFFFDTPEHCGTSSQIAISGNSKIVATGYNKDTKQFGMPGFYLLGTGTSQVSISGTSSGNEFIVYAPDSYVTIGGTASKGIIVGRKVTVNGTVKLEQDQGFEAPDEINPRVGAEEEVLTIKEERERKEAEEETLKQEEEEWRAGHPASESSPIFSAQTYVECTGGVVPTGAVPNASC